MAAKCQEETLPVLRMGCGAQGARRSPKTGSLVTPDVFEVIDCSGMFIAESVSLGKAMAERTAA
jgi:hypothetical protein